MTGISRDKGKSRRGSEILDAGIGSAGEGRGGLHLILQLSVALL